MEKLKNGQKCKRTRNDIFYTFNGNNIKSDISGENLLNLISDKDFATEKFEILSEEEEKIDIQAITCFDEIRDVSTWCNEALSQNQRNIVSKINKIIKAVKQLDRKKED